MSIFTNSYNIVSYESSNVFMMADNGSGNGSDNGSDQNPHHSDEELDPGYEDDSDVDIQDSMSEGEDGLTVEGITNILEGKTRAEVDQWFIDEQTRIDNERDNDLTVEDDYDDNSDSGDSAVVPDQNNDRQQAIRDIHTDKSISLEEKKEIVYENLGFLDDSVSRDSDAGLAGDASRDSDTGLTGDSYKGSEDTGSNEHSNKRSRNDYDSDNNDNSTKKVKKKLVLVVLAFFFRIHFCFFFQKFLIIMPFYFYIKGNFHSTFCL